MNIDSSKSATWLPNYQITKKQWIKSLVFSEYALRHVKEGKNTGKIGHYVIAAIEFIPVLGALASLIEGIIAKILNQPFFPPQLTDGVVKKPGPLNEDVFKEDLKTCVEAFNKEQNTANFKNYSVGFDFSKTTQTVANLALEFLALPPSDYYTFSSARMEDYRPLE